MSVHIAAFISSVLPSFPPALFKAQNFGGLRALKQVEAQ